MTSARYLRDVALQHGAGNRPNHPEVLARGCRTDVETRPSVEHQTTEATRSKSTASSASRRDRISLAVQASPHQGQSTCHWRRTKSALQSPSVARPWIPLYTMVYPVAAKTYSPLIFSEHQLEPSSAIVAPEMQHATAATIPNCLVGFFIVKVSSIVVELYGTELRTCSQSSGLLAAQKLDQQAGGRDFGANGGALRPARLRKLLMQREICDPPLAWHAPSG